LIYISDEFVPSTLFCLKPSGVADYLERTACLCHEMGDLLEAERCAQQVRDESRASQLHVEHTAALILLSDIYRERGNLGTALRYAQEAYDIVKCQAGEDQRHNEAVAAYDLGLIHHLMQDDVRAANWYQTARELFGAAQRYWARHKEKEKMRACTWMEQWLGALCDFLARKEGFVGFRSILLLSALVIGRRFSLARWGVDNGQLDPNLAIEGDSFYTVPPGGMGFQPGKEYRIFRVPEQVCNQLGFQEGDCVLGQRTGQQGSPGKPYYVVERNVEADFARFRRDPATGEISFECLVTGQIIGGWDDPYLCIYSPLVRLSSTPPEPQSPGETSDPKTVKTVSAS